MSLTPISKVNHVASRLGVLVGERLLSINGTPILDVLDYKFHSYDASLALELQDPEGKKRQVLVEKEEGEDLGLEFETYLMDKARSCANDCLFCFVDQMPEGMRDSLYFKDDDARLSFLTGNYITMTNLSPRERKRIVDLRISPINISVHATDPTVRQEMLKHPKAGECLAVMEEFAKGNITMNAQVVACPSINDGAILQKTLEDLSQLHPQVNSISVVPVGITKYREHLPNLSPYTKETASEVLSIVEEFAAKHKEEKGTSLVWCSDEFYLKAQRDLPEEDYYEEFTQLDNGVGMLRMFSCEFLRGLKLMEGEELKGADFVIATGVAAAPMLTELVEIAKKTSENAGYDFKGKVIAIENDFFGHTINVAGLVTGRDLIAKLKGEPLAPQLLLSESMLRHGEQVFLDDITLKQVEEALNVTVIPVPQDGYDLVDAIYNVFTPAPREENPITVPISQEAYLYNPSK